jgi:peptide chain release factor subunit 3
VAQITVEVGRAHFATEKKRYTLLDAPGHKNYVPNMIGGASQADVGVLVISARKGEFETGFDRGGQTREHAMLAKTLGLHRLVILVNKMDDPTVNWEQKRFDEIEGKLTPFLKKTGFNMSRDVIYIPASGFTGANIRDPVTPEVCPWVKDRRSLFQVLDDMPPLPRDAAGGLRLPIVARYKDMGALFVLGKLESGTLVKEAKLLMMPNRIEVQCIGITVDDVEVDVAKPGENVLVKIKGIEEEDVQEGFVLSYPDRPCRRSAVLEGQVAILDLLEHKPILTIGYAAILHVHALAVECTITHLVSEIDRKTGEPLPQKPRFLKAGGFANVRIRLNESIAVEAFKDYQALGRFTLRDEGKTIAIGKILRMKDE